MQRGEPRQPVMPGLSAYRRKTEKANFCSKPQIIILRHHLFTFLHIPCFFHGILETVHAIAGNFWIPSQNDDAHRDLLWFWAYTGNIHSYSCHKMTGLIIFCFSSVSRWSWYEKRIDTLESHPYCGILPFDVYSGYGLATRYWLSQEINVSWLLLRYRQQVRGPASVDRNERRVVLP